MQLRRPLAALIPALVVCLLACGAEGEGGSAAAPSGAATQSVASPPASPEKAEAPPERHERPLPAFGGYTLDGKRLDISSLIGKRVLIVFFNPEVKDAKTVLDAVVSVSKLRGKNNFEVVGVAMGSTLTAARDFAQREGISFPVIDDSSARIANQFGLRVPIAILGVDAEGYMIFGLARFPTEAPHAERIVETQLREALRLPALDESVPGTQPMAPEFKARMLDSKLPFDLAAHRGQPIVLTFFLHTCPHCHDLLRFMKKWLPEMPEKQRPLFVGIEVTGQTDAVRAELEQDGFDFFPVLFDDDGQIANAYGAYAGVPDTFGIDAEGHIVWRMQGWRPETDGPLLRMRMAKLGGGPVPMLLAAQGYSGNDICGVCHVREHETWEFTAHASAYDTLVRHGSASDPACVKCHVVGFGQKGGFEIANPMPQLENVGCETCHGRGGPHLSPAFAKRTSYESTCVGCHDATHSLGFDYASFEPRISHAANEHILSLPPAEQRRILAERGAVRKDILPTAAAYVGSDACRSCHEAEYATWSKGPHAKALAALASKGKQDDQSCLTCHTTAYGRKGGFPRGAPPAGHPDLARVGCESCHGPGGRHVGKDAPRRGTIVSLGDKCDSCVVLQICGSCHDEANDPGFEFEVQAKIDRIRHGTIEAGTGRPLKPAAGPPGAQSSAADAVWAGRAFAWLEGRGSAP